MKLKLATCTLAILVTVPYFASSATAQTRTADRAPVDVSSRITGDFEWEFNLSPIDFDFDK